MSSSLHHLDESSQSIPETKSARKKFSPVSLVVPLLIVIVAILLGRFAAQLSAKNSSDMPQVTYTQNNSLLQSKFGQKNEKLCPDKVEGTLKKGGVEGEGTHHLVRKGGSSQNVYLTSSTVDLSQVVNKKVKVWGKTYAAQTAGWLMDVCYLEVE